MRCLPMSVRRLLFVPWSISKTKQDRPIVTMKHYIEVGPADFSFLPI